MGREYILGVDSIVLLVWLVKYRRKKEEFEDEIQFSGWVGVLYIEMMKDAQVVRVRK